MRVVGVLEIVSINAFEDCAVVLPSLSHAIHWWPIITKAYQERHGENNIEVTKTAIVSKNTRRVLRLWVRYERQPTMPLDWRHYRRGFRFLDLYGLCGGRIR